MIRFEIFLWWMKNRVSFWRASGVLNIGLKRGGLLCFHYETHKQVAAPNLLRPRQFLAFWTFKTLILE